MDRSVEDTLARLRRFASVEKYLIVDAQGTVLRSSKSLPAGEAAVIAAEMLALTSTARRAMRDLNPKVRARARRGARRARSRRWRVLGRFGCSRAAAPLAQTDLTVFRLRGREREIIAAPGPGDAFLVIVVQRWAPAPVAASDAQATAAGGGLAAVTNVHAQAMAAGGTR